MVRARSPPMVNVNPPRVHVNPPWVHVNPPWVNVNAGALTLTMEGERYPCEVHVQCFSQKDCLNQKTSFPKVVWRAL